MPISAFRATAVQVSGQSSCPIGAGLNGIWVDSAVPNVLRFRKTDGTDTALGGGGGSSTLSGAYGTGASQSDSTLSLDSTRLGLVLKDAASSIGSLLKVQDNAGAANYLLVPGNAAIEIRSATANGASAVGTVLDSVSSLSNATAKTISVRNAGTELWYYSPSAQGTANKGKFKAATADDFWFESSDGLAKLKISTTAGTALLYNTCQLLVGNSVVVSGAAGLSTPHFTIGGSAVSSGVPCLQLNAATHKTYFAMGTGNSDVTAAIVEEYVASGTVTAGEVVVWSGTTTAKTVATAAASANLTTIAGVAITTATNANVQVVTFGRCKAKCAASFAPTAGQLLGTSGTTAGQVTNGTPGAGAIIGRALTGDNTASSGAGFCWIQVALS